MRKTEFEMRLSQLFPWISITIFMLYMFNPLHFDFSFAHWDINGGADSILQATFIKTIIESGWIYSNTRLGAPFGANFLDFPGADGLMLLQIKLFTLVSSDPTTVLNLFYAFSFVLIFSCAFWVFRKFDIDPILSTAAALIYTCTPYHFLRGTNHLYLSNYFIVPLLIWIAISIYPGDKTSSLDKPIFQKWYYIPLLLGAGSAGIYYAFFGLVLIFVTGMIGTVEEKSWLYSRRASTAIVFIIAGVLINLGPSLAHNWQEGKNPEVATRSPTESELYGLRLGQLLLPIWGHQNSTIANFSRKYHESVKPITEAPSSALGLIGSLGFLLLFAALLFNKLFFTDKRIHVLARLNLVLFSFAVIGGFGVLFAILVTPQLRGTNRASIYIAFISILALFLWLKSNPRLALNTNSNLRHVKPILTTLLVLFALYDQIPAGARIASGGTNIGFLKKLFPHAYNQNIIDDHRLSNNNFKDFIFRIEKAISTNGMIYVLPYVPFPESPPIFDEGYNALLRPYYYSSHARWSYGSMKGRSGDVWTKAVESLSLEEKIKALQMSGFEGIYIERKAYKDHGIALEKDLRNILQGEVLESADRNQVFYRLKPETISAITPSFLLSGGSDVYPLEKEGDKTWLWSKRNGKLLFYNFTDKALKVVFRASAASLDARRLTINSKKSILYETTLRPNHSQSVEVPLALAPGVNIVTISSDKPDFHIPTDPRGLSVMLMQPRLTLE